jgi:TrbC/VIRB2 pilin
MSSITSVSMFQVPMFKSESARQWFKALMWSVLIVAMAIVMMSPALAGPTGGAAGTAAATQTRILGVVTGWQLILFAIGAFIVAGAFMYVGYGMMFGGKQLKDMTNVVFGAMIAGMGPMLAGWLFS